MTGAEVRSAFLEFFRARGHQIVRSSSLVPENDPTLLFTNAGMVQFKNVFLGQQRRANPRAASSQKCLRLSGKHNDLEAVGRDTYHHTFFEMLGNWSFGEYYKKEAIAWAWELLTEVWGLPKAALWATVFRTDDEADAFWRSQTDVDRAQILRFDEKDNFWEMGETGPCGPCSEIHIDRGPGSCDRQHVPGHQCAVNAGCARFIELWNLVFIQYDRGADGKLSELAAKHVDTGMGLERITAVLQNVSSNYDTDLLRNLIRFTEQQSGRTYGRNEDDDLAMRVIADHSRALHFMIADGVAPANDGRGYVLRRILRRAARHAKVLGFDQPYLYRMSEPVIGTMGAAYPELVERRAPSRRSSAARRSASSETLDKGLALLEQERADLERRGEVVLSGDVAFRLYDTYGFPLDMTEDILRGDGIRVDTEGFDRCMDEQRRRAREARKGAGPEVMTGSGDASSHFTGDRVYELAVRGRRPRGRRRAAARGARGRHGPGGDRGDALLRGIRRSGRRPRHHRDRRRRSDRDHGYAEAASRPDRPPRPRRPRRVVPRRTRSPAGRPPAPRRHASQPLRDPHPARRTAPVARRARAPGGLPGRARPPALRLQPLGRDRRGVAATGSRRRSTRTFGRTLR